MGPASGLYSPSPLGLGQNVFGIDFPGELFKKGLASGCRDLPHVVAALLDLGPEARAEGAFRWGQQNSGLPLSPAETRLGLGALASGRSFG